MNCTLVLAPGPWAGYLLLLCGMSIAILNLLIITILLLQKSEWTLTTKYILCLLFSHFLAGVTGIMLFIYERTSGLSVMLRSTENDFFVISKSLLDTALCSSFSSIVLVTFDRLITVRFPFIYQQLDRKKIFTSFVLAFAIPFIFFVCAVSTRISSTIYLIYLVMIILTTSMVSISNYIIYRQVLVQLNSIKVNIVADNLTECEKHKKQLHLRQVKSTQVCLILASSFVFFWMPVCVNTMAVLFMGWERYCQVAHMNLRVAAHAIAYCNSFFDPILYSYFTKDIKNKIRRVTRLRFSFLSSETMPPTRRDINM